MSKYKRRNPPNFDFYPEDFLVGVIGMPLSSVGAYIKLLCLQWDRGAIPNDNQAVSALLSISVEECAQIMRDLRPKFVEDGPNLVNERLAVVRAEAIARLETYRNNGSMGGRPRKTNGFQSGSCEETKNKPTRQMEEGSRKKADPSEKKVFVAPTLDELRTYLEEAGITIDAEAFMDHYTSNGWKVGGRAPMKDWRSAARNWARRQATDATPADTPHDRLRRLS